MEFQPAHGGCATNCGRQMCCALLGSGLYESRSLVAQNNKRILVSWIAYNILCLSQPDIRLGKAKPGKLVRFFIVALVNRDSDNMLHFERPASSDPRRAVEIHEQTKQPPRARLLCSQPPGRKRNQETNEQEDYVQRCDARVRTRSICNTYANVGRGIVIGERRLNATADGS